MRSLLLSLCLLAPGPAPAQPVTYLLDPDHSFVHFEVVHFGTSTTRGRFGPVTGEVTLDRQAGSGRAELTVATASVDTGLRFFDARLRQDDLLASDDFPVARFEATDFRYDGDRLVALSGDLTLRGHRRPITLSALRFGCRIERAQGTEICGGDFEAEVHRTPFGMLYGWPFIGNRIGLRIQVEGFRPLP